MTYAIRLANGEVQPVTESAALNNEQVDGLLGGGATLVSIDANGRVTPLDVFGDLEESDERGPTNTTWRAAEFVSHIVRLEDASGPEYSGALMGITIRFTTEGPLRGRCGHQHKNIESAVKCLDDDEAWCRERGGGGHSDRQIFVVGAGTKRELNDAERAAVEAYRSAPR